MLRKLSPTNYSFWTVRWTIACFVVAICVALSPNIIFVAGVHGNYDNWMAKSRTLLFSDATRLFLFGRPVAALTSNWPLLPLEKLSDYHWLRLFSVATVCVLGSQLIVMCMKHVRVGELTAFAVAVAVFLVPSISVSILEPAAWGPHLLTILLGFGAYRSLVKANALLLPLFVSVSAREYRVLALQTMDYLRLRPVIIACCLYQLAFYNYPPSALFLMIFPVIGVLFSRPPSWYKYMVAARDFVFVGVNISFYWLSAKIVYFPLVRADVPFIRSFIGDLPVEEGEFWQKVGKTYAFELQSNLGVIVERVKELASVAGNLWFMPQTRIHVLVVILLVIAVAIWSGTQLLGRRQIDSPRRNVEIAVNAAVVFACFVFSGAPTLFSVGGIFNYRTIASPTAVCAIAVLYLAQAVAGRAWKATGHSCAGATGARNAVMLAMVGAAMASTLYSNVLTMKLAHNELAYYKNIVRQAIDSHSNAIVIIDDRPLFLPEDLKVAYDEQGRWIPPYDLGCFSGYCIQTDAIVRAVIRMVHDSDERFTYWLPRNGDPVPGVTCEMLTAETPKYPAGASARSIALIDGVRSHAPVACFKYDLRWHDLSARQPD